MAKSKAQAKVVPTPVKATNGVKSGRVTKPAKTEKAKSQDIAKKISKKEIKVPVKEDSDSASDSDSGSDSDASDSSEASDSEDSVKDKANGNKPPIAVESDDESDSDSDSEDDSEDEAKPALKGVNGVKAGKDNVDGSEEESFHSAEDKPTTKFQPDSDADSDEDEDEDDSDDSDDSDNSDSDEEPAKKSVKVNGSAKQDNGDDEEDDDDDDDDNDSDESDSSEDDEEEKPVSKKRKADEEEAFVAKKSKASNDEIAQEGANGETTNLFIGRISWATDDDALYQEFSPFGNIVGCRVVYERDSGRSKGFGYVQFEKLADAIAAKEAKHGSTFDGREINVDFSQPRDANGPPKREAYQDRAKKFGDVLTAPQDTLFIGNLSFDATYDHVKEVFSEYGEITRISLPTDRETGQIKGFGYVGFSSVEEAKAALEAVSGTDIAGRPVRLDYATARPNNDNSSPRGGRGGFGGRGNSRGGFGGGGGRGGRDGGFRGGGRGGRGGFGNRPQSTNRGGVGEFSGKKITF